MSHEGYIILQSSKFYLHFFLIYDGVGVGVVNWVFGVGALYNIIESEDLPME